MTHISNFENSGTISEKMQEEESFLVGVCVGGGGVDNFRFTFLELRVVVLYLGRNVPQQLERWVCG